MRGNQLTTAGNAGSATASLVATWLLIAQQITTETAIHADKHTARAYARAGRPAPTVRLLSVRSRRTTEPFSS